MKKNWLYWTLVGLLVLSLIVVSVDSYVRHQQFLEHSKQR